MIFTDIRFIALFVACWLCFFAVPPRWRTATLAFWGALFYSLYAGAFLPVVLALTVVTLFSERRVVAWTVAATTLGLLGYFKIHTEPLGGSAAASSAGIIIPLGFSYLAFELLHVVIERRRGRIAPMSWPDLMAFIFFAPARVAGPIKRFPDFIAAVRAASGSSEQVYAGVVRVLIGLAKKVLVADVLALTVAEHRYASSALHAWTVVVAFAFQIYFDFSAYSDIAIGFARMLGITLPENFSRPYLAVNIREFWDRWHITLSHWVRDYIFLPTGRALFQTRLRSRPLAIAAVSYLLTFLALGAWHGVTAAFLAWGAYHGLLLTAHQIVRAKMPARVAGHAFYHSRWVSGVGCVVTFLCVAVGWVPFMTTWARARVLLTLMFGFGS